MVQKLWRVKGGTGAATLPSEPSAPQLTSLVLRLPNPANGYDAGARGFWRNFLPGLQYHNLTLPINVEQTLRATPDVAPTLTLQFEATTREALERQKAEPTLSDFESLAKSRDQLQEIEREQKEEEMAGGPVAPKKNEKSWLQQLRKQQMDIGVPSKYQTSVGSITIKPQPAADPATPSTTSPPVTLYQRTVTLGLRGRHAKDIWAWFAQLTDARQFELERDEIKAKTKYKRHEVRAAKDRQRVKEGIDTMRREKEDLKRAKEAAERLAET